MKPTPGGAIRPLTDADRAAFLRSDTAALAKELHTARSAVWVPLARRIEAAQWPTQQARSDARARAKERIAELRETVRPALHHRITPAGREWARSGWSPKTFLYRLGSPGWNDVAILARKGHRMITRTAPLDIASPRPAAEWVRIGDLLPWERNPKAHPVENVAEIARSIVRFGFTEPIICWGSRKQVVAGHGRLLAAQMLYREDAGRKVATDQPGQAATNPADGLVPVRWIEFASDHEAAAYAIADNRLTEKNPMDAALVAEIFLDLDAHGVSVEGLGYGEEELQQMLDPAARQEEEEPADTSQQVGELAYRLIVVCRNEVHQGELLERLEREGLECQPLIS